MSKDTAQSRQLRQQPALQLIEEAVRQLRAAPGSFLLAHFFGSAPCMLFGVYFFTDLSRGAFADEHVVGESLTFALLYGWMKSWQSISAAYLQAALLRQPSPRWDAARLIRLAAVQMLLQPIGLVLRFVASVFLLPYVWVATFFQNITILGDGSYLRLGELWGDAWTEAKRWPKQAHGLASYLTIIALFIYINFGALAASVPMLLKTIFGIDTALSHYAAGMVNPTFLVAMAALTYLVLDPIRKAAVAVRCFQGRSIITGEDLAVELKEVRRPPTGVAAVLAGLCFLFGGFDASAPAAVPAPPPARVEPSELNHSIDDVLNRREFTWRSGREKAPEKEVAKMNWFEKWQHDFGQWKDRMIWKTGKSIQAFFKKLWEWIFGKEGEHKKSDKDHDFLSWMNSVRFVFWIVAILSAAVLAVLIARRWRLPLSEPVIAEPIAPTPDLREESVTADQLPEDGWIQLARELFGQGELRLALRAFYLAGLAHLGTRDYIRLARHKSNRDYDSELRRRARAEVELIAVFGKNLQAFERAWYGDHPVTPESLGEFSANLERIRAC